MGHSDLADRTDYEAVIGLECHVQLHTRSKIFTPAAAAFGGTPNSHTDPYTLGLPGTLPVLNRQAVEFAMRVGLSCGCQIRRRSRFARKHYFYPDLPKGYQISQYDEPVCEGGQIEFLLHAERRQVKLIRIHLEEDAGKNLHASTSFSLVDYNRAGVPLIEIVSQPDIRSAEEAAEYLRAVRQLVRFLRISDGNMEEGSLRCDANVSLRRRGDTGYGVKTELKNINSFRHVQKAIEHEVQRQAEVLAGGGKIVQETRGWDAERGASFSQRSKEEAHDYRYFPDPDLPPLVIDEAWIQRVRSDLPETPSRRRDRYVGALGLSTYDAGLLTAELEIGDYFDAVIAACTTMKDLRATAKLAANWVSTELLGALNRDGKAISIEQSPLTPAMLAELCGLIEQGTISGKIAKDVFAKAYASGRTPRVIVEEEGLSQVTDGAVIEAACKKVVELPQHQKQAEKYRAGNDKLLGFFVGQVMKETGGRASPELVNQILRRMLSA